MIALVFCGDLKYCPYIRRYLERLDAANAAYRVYFWNRSGLSLQLPQQYRWYDNHSALTSGKAKKLVDFLGFRAWLLRELGRDKPDRVIALSTLSGVFLGSFLYRKYRRKYVFDIRDYSYEHVGPFYAIEKKLVENSAFTAISSKGFRAFLPQHDYVIAHNFNRGDIQPDARFRPKDAPLKFVWNGVIRYFEYQTRYLDALKNDGRFEIVFHGDGPDLEKYKKYCAENGFRNAVFTGSYDNADKASLLADAAILNNCYGYLQNAGNKIRYAVSNRFYDGMVYHIPQVVEPEGFKPEWAKESGIGVSFPPDGRFADRLYEYYRSLDGEAFDAACRRTLKTVLEEDDGYVARIDAFIRGEEANN